MPARNLSQPPGTQFHARPPAPGRSRQQRRLSSIRACTPSQVGGAPCVVGFQNSPALGQQPLCGCELRLQRRVLGWKREGGGVRGPETPVLGGGGRGSRDARQLFAHTGRGEEQEWRVQSGAGARPPLALPTHLLPQVGRVIIWPRLAASQGCHLLQPGSVRRDRWAQGPNPAPAARSSEPGVGPVVPGTPPAVAVDEVPRG